MAGSIQAPRAGLGQPTRLAIAVSYVIGLLFLGLYLNGQIPPPFGLEGLWFYAAFAALVLGEFIIEPFFTRPADALANGVALLFGAASVSLAGAEIGASAASAGRTVYLALGVTVIVVAAIAVAFKDSGGWAGGASGVAAFLAGRSAEHAFFGVSSSSAWGMPHLPTPPARSQPSTLPGLRSSLWVHLSGSPDFIADDPETSKEVSSSK